MMYDDNSIIDKAIPPYVATIKTEKNSQTALIGHYINDEIVFSPSTLPVENPATEQVVAQVCVAGRKELELALNHANAAFANWSEMPPLNRSRILFRFKAILDERKEILAATITNEHGKTLEDATGEVIRGIEVVEFACGAPYLLRGNYNEQVSREIDSWNTLQPLGVVSGITPFNFPVMIPLWMAPLSIVCGNCFILKPSEKDPGPSLLIAKWLTEAGLPPGVFQVLQGNQDIVNMMIEHPQISAISFVGSTPVAKHIYSSASKQGKRVQALGGAKNHLLVSKTADLQQVCNALIGSAYGSAGERCMAISVVVALEDIADELVAMLKTRTETLTIGEGTKDGVEMGPLISAEHRQRIISLIEEGVNQGATLVSDGRKQQFKQGYFLAASLFDHVTPEMKIYQEEIFGPVLCVVRVPSFGEGIQLINSCQYANGTSLFTRDGAEARLFAHSIQVGMVGINIPIPVPMPFHSFCGWKSSVFGSLGMYGEDGIRFYTQRKTIISRWSHAHLGSEFSMPIMTSDSDPKN